MARRRIVNLAATALLLLGGCAVSLERVAPPVTSLPAAAGDSTPEVAARLDRGRAVYLDQCARCHRPYPVTGYTADRWAKLLPDMIDRTRLDPGPAADLTAYVRRAAGADATP